MIQTMLLDLLKTNLILITMTEKMMREDQEAQTTDQEDILQVLGLKNTKS